MHKHTIRRSVPVDKIGDYMASWQAKRPGLVAINVIGKSGKYDIYSAVFTNKSVSDENKQIVLVIAQHSGMEITGMTSILSLGNYLVSGAEEAEALLEKLVIVAVPCPNPYSYSMQSADFQFKNEAGVDEYVSFDYNGAKKGGKNPAAAAIQQLIDRYRPELLLDCHGVMYDKQLVGETFGISAFASNKLYNGFMTNEIQQAATDAGFAQFSEDFHESLLMTDKDCADEEITGHFRTTLSGAIAPIYAYLHYHTLAASFEIAWEKSGLARLVKALEIGCETLKGEYYAGYPVNTVVEPYGHNSIRAWGTTAAERRKSRLELWRGRNRILIGVAHPEMPGLAAVIVSCSKKSANRIVGRWYAPMLEVCENMRGMPGVNADNMTREFERFYESYAMASIECGDEIEIENGMTLRFGLPFQDAEVEQVMYNGNIKSEDEEDGYTVVKSDNWVFVDLHVPPGKTAEFAIGMVKYNCTVPETGIVEF